MTDNTGDSFSEGAGTTADAPHATHTTGHDIGFFPTGNQLKKFASTKNFSLKKNDLEVDEGNKCLIDGTVAGTSESIKKSDSWWMTTETKSDKKISDTEESRKGTRAYAWTWVKQFGQEIKEAADWCEKLKKLPVKEGEWHVFAVEKGTRYHIQGASTFKTQRTIESVKKLTGASWARKSNGTPKQNRDYVLSEAEHAGKEHGMKAAGGIFGEVGKMPEPKRPGARTDLAEFVAEIDKKTDEQLKASYPGYVFRYSRLLDAYRSINWRNERRNPNTAITVTVLCGDAGTGKSTRARRLVGPKPYERAGQMGTWWSGYQGERDAILEEFDWQQVPIDTLKTWLDRWPCQVSGKGQMGYVPLLVTNFVLTCQDHPSEWYPQARLADKKALARRMKIFRLTDERAVEDGVRWDTTEEKILLG